MKFDFIAKPNGLCSYCAFKDISMTMMVDFRNQHPAFCSFAEWFKLRCIFFCAGVTVILREVIMLISSRRAALCLSAEGRAARLGCGSEVPV